MMGQKKEASSIDEGKVADEESMDFESLPMDELYDAVLNHSATSSIPIEIGGKAIEEPTIETMR